MKREGVIEAFAAHSIIAVKGDGPVEEGDDGVVTYRSAHIDEAVSERVVRSGHSVQGHPEAIEEIRLILLEHAAPPAATGEKPDRRNHLEPALRIR